MLFFVYSQFLSGNASPLDPVLNNINSKARAASIICRGDALAQRAAAHFYCTQLPAKGRDRCLLSSRVIESHIAILNPCFCSSEKLSAEEIMDLT